MVYFLLNFEVNEIIKHKWLGKYFFKRDNVYSVLNVNLSNNK